MPIESGVLQAGDSVDETIQTLRIELPNPPTVLIVDDDELVLAHLRERVSSAGYAVCTAAGGHEALQTLRDTAATVVVSDVNMPGMDGIALCRAIREHAWPGYIYVVLLTARGGGAQHTCGPRRRRGRLLEQTHLRGAVRGPLTHRKTGAGARI